MKGEYGFEFAYRTAKEIRQYIIASYRLAEGTGMPDIYDVMDEQVLQKILPRIHGNKKEIGTMLDRLGALCDEPGKELKMSSEKIKQMKKRLESVQYASFI